MLLPTPNIAVNPAIAGNLRGLREVAVEVQTELMQFPSLFDKLNPVAMRSQIEARLTQAGLVVRDSAPAAFVVSVAAEQRIVPAINGVAAIFAVATTVRELLLLPRAGDDPLNSGDGRLVDTWRHKEATGILLPQTSIRQASALLLGECYRQVEEFARVWLRDQVNQMPPAPPTPTPPPTPPADPADPGLARIKKALEDALQGLALGNEGRASLEQFDVAGTNVTFRARIRHRQVAGRVFGRELVVYDLTTHAAGAFDAANPATLRFQLCVDKPALAGGGRECINVDLPNP